MNRYHSAAKTADSKEEVNMRTTSGRGSGAFIVLLAAILMPLLGFSTVNAQEVGDKVNLLVPDVSEFADPAQSRQFTVLAETPHALWLVQDTCWVDAQGGGILELDTLLSGLQSLHVKYDWDVSIIGDMMTMEEFEDLTEVFESTVWGTVTSIWGEPVLTVPDGEKIWIAIAAIPTKYNSSSTTVAPRNQMYHVNPEDLMGEFNARDIFYLNAHAVAYNPGLLEYAVPIRQWNLANGLATLCRYGRNINEEPWLLRGMAEVAQYETFGLTSIGQYGISKIISTFELAPYIELVNSTTGNGALDFSSSRGQQFMFFMYLRQRAGESVIQAIAQGDSTGMMNVALALNPSAAPETAVQDEVVPLYWDWLVCNLNHRFLSDYAGGIYMYDFLVGTPSEDFGHANMGAAFTIKVDTGDYPIPATMPSNLNPMSAPIWAAQYCYFRGLTGTEADVLFNGQYSDGSGGGSAVASRWEAKAISYNESTGEFISVTDVTLDDFYNGSFGLAGDATYLIVTNNNPGGAVNLRYVVSQDYVPPSLIVAVHQNQVSDNFANVYAVGLNEATLEMEGFDWVGPIFSTTLGSVTTPIKMEQFYGGQMWRGNVDLTTDGNYTLNFAGYDSSSTPFNTSVAMAVGTLSGKLTLDVGGIRLDVPEGAAAPGSRVVLSETGMLGLSIGTGASMAEASGMLTGVLAGPVSIPAVNGTLSFPAVNADASVFVYGSEGWVKLDSYFQDGRICAPVTEGGIYVLGEAPGVTSPSVPVHVEIEGNFPNPFNSQTVIRFATPAQGLVTMRVFDLSGRLVRTLANEEMAAANHSIVWDGTNSNGQPLGAGVYFCRLEAQGQVLTQKIMMVE
jgi:hypothetical protein